MSDAKTIGDFDPSAQADPYANGEIANHALYDLVANQGMTRRQVIDLLIDAIPDINTTGVSDAEYIEELRQAMYDNASSANKAKVDAAFGKIDVAPEPVTDIEEDSENCTSGVTVTRVNFSRLLDPDRFDVYRGGHFSHLLGPLDRDDLLNTTNTEYWEYIACYGNLCSVETVYEQVYICPPP